MPDLNLPDLIFLEDYEGDFHVYNDAVYGVFRRDFVANKPSYKGKRLALKAHPIVDGKEYTYYHFTHSGNIETDRIPDFRRMERIGYPNPLINNSTHTTLKVWRNKRGNNNRILIFHEEEGYLVVLDDRQEYILPWTAYYVEYNHQKRKFIKEYEAYWKSQEK